MDICMCISLFLIFTIGSGNINATLKKNGILKLLQLSNSNACFQQRRSSDKAYIFPS